MRVATDTLLEHTDLAASGEVGDCYRDVIEAPRVVDAVTAATHRFSRASGGCSVTSNRQVRSSGSLMGGIGPFAGANAPGPVIGQQRGRNDAHGNCEVRDLAAPPEELAK